MVKTKSLKCLILQYSLFIFFWQWKVYTQLCNRNEWRSKGYEFSHGRFYRHESIQLGVFDDARENCTKEGSVLAMTKNECDYKATVSYARKCELSPSLWIFWLFLNVKERKAVTFGLECSIRTQTTARTLGALENWDGSTAPPSCTRTITRAKRFEPMRDTAVSGFGEATISMIDLANWTYDLCVKPNVTVSY